MLNSRKNTCTAFVIHFSLFILSCMICTLCTSCENPIGDVMLRTYRDPFDAAPVVDSMRDEEKIYISWDKDEACDEYILLRAEDSVTPRFDEIYRGTDLSFIDSGLSVNKKYLYRLDKVRGKVHFISEKKGYGFCSPKRRDVFDNHTKQNALFLNPCVSNLNIYIAIFSDGHVMYEEDWFYIRVPARSVSTIVVSQKDPITNIPLIDYLVEANQFQNVDQSFAITNDKMIDQFIPFKLRVNSTPSAPDIVTYNIGVTDTKPF
ncbi:MAG: hypothetical protein J6Y36_07240 [Treponema sp.]|nr:hypothetical protein [Treponema sp.]